MELTDSQEEQIKEQLRLQVKDMPEEQKKQAEEQINAMTKEQIIELIKKNQKAQGQGENGCIFCAILEGKTPSIKIDENEEAIAIMDINPIAKGHVLIVPKDHSKEPSEKSQQLAFDVGGRILKTLKPNDITTRAAKVMDHTILNVIPIYNDTDFEKRITVTEEALVKTAEEISEIPLEKKSKIDKPPKIEPKEQLCIFCAIAKGQTPAYKIDENKDALAILEINPIAKGHTIVIPFIHTQTTAIPTSAFTLAKKIAKKITTKYKPNDVKINPTSIENHSIIEIIPFYDDTDPTKRTKISAEEITKIQKDLSKKPKESKATTKKAKKTTKNHLRLKSTYPHLPQMKPRIP